MLSDSQSGLHPGTFEYLEAVRRREGGPQQWGDDFEWLCAYFLRHAPTYRHLIERVWLWDDYPDRTHGDYGIDLVAQTNDGNLWAVQAKAIGAANGLPKAEVDSFLNVSARPQYAYRLIITTTDEISRPLDATINEAQIIPVGLVRRTDLLAERLTWPTRIGDEPPQPHIAPFEARPHQVRACADIVRGFETHDRGKLIMACGTGKTFVGLQVAEALESRRTLVAVPSLLLVSQTLHEWMAHARRPIVPLAVCGDQKIGQRRKTDVALLPKSALGLPGTTDPSTIAEYLAGPVSGAARVVFATYQSAKHIADAQAAGAPPFDLVIADEAHHCVGAASGMFGSVVDATQIRGRKRLFMTATPRILTVRDRRRAAQEDLAVLSMDDEDVFGPELFTMDFADAVHADPPLLTDYRVVVVGIEAETAAAELAATGRLVQVEGNVTDARTLAAQIGLAKAIRDYDLRSVITFHSSVRKASVFTDASRPESFPRVVARLSDAARPVRTLWTRHVNGTMPTKRREDYLKELRSIPDDVCGVISNCACLSEGVDVPALDGVAFIDPKRSQVDIVQAVGRAMRLSSTKTMGTVVVPVLVDHTEDPDARLRSSAFDSVWAVLRALTAHDPKLGDAIAELRLHQDQSTGGPQRPPRLVLDLPVEFTPQEVQTFENAFYARLVERTTKRPPLTEAQILEWADAHHERTGKWPTVALGAVTEAPSVTWANINQNLREGERGLLGGKTLPEFLIARGRRRGDVSQEQILVWADAHHARTGEWPHHASGSVTGAPDLNWSTIDGASRYGRRGLPGGQSLSECLIAHGRRATVADLTVEQILAWVDAHHERTGKWPNVRSGAVTEAPGQTWAAIGQALNYGYRALPGGQSLLEFLIAHGRLASAPDLTAEQILAWADAHYTRTGQWPNTKSGAVIEDPRETWGAIAGCLRKGSRGLPGGSNLGKFLLVQGRAPTVSNLTEAQILGWARAYIVQHQRPPTRHSGPVDKARGESWGTTDEALKNGRRGLPGGSSVSQLLIEHGLRKAKQKKR